MQKTLDTPTPGVCPRCHRYTMHSITTGLHTAAPRADGTVFPPFMYTALLFCGVAGQCQTSKNYT